MNIQDIKVLINEKKIDYDVVELDNKNEHPYFCVGKRYRIICRIPEHLKREISIKCVVEMREDIQVHSGPETGEDLAMLSLYWEKYKLSIGTKGDIERVKYNYLEKALEVIFQENPRQFTFYVAWMEITDMEKESIYTWFAADPSYDV